MRPQDETGVIGKTIRSEAFFPWKMVALMKGLGFRHTRKEDAGGRKGFDRFSNRWNLIELFHGYRKARLPHRPYVTVVTFWMKNDHSNVIGFSGNPSNPDELYRVVALSGIKEWEAIMSRNSDDVAAGVTEWVEKHEVKL